MKNIIIVIIAANVFALAQWKVLEPGLEWGTFPSPHYPGNDSAVVRVLRIDTKHFELRLLNASHPSQGELLTAREWAKKEGMAAVINAAMYQTDYRKSVSLMKTSGHVNNSRVSKDKTILVFEPLVKNIPSVRIVDLECDDFEKIGQHYGSAVQSIRMISCTGKNVWQESGKRWSIAAVGTDRSGRVLFIQCTAPHSVYEINNVLKDLPIAIDRAMYMEGGSPSQLYINSVKDTMGFIGDFSIGGKPAEAEGLPNVLGAQRRR